MATFVTWERASIIAGAIVAVGTIVAGLGYGWPWTPASAGQKLDQREQQHYVTLQSQIQQTNKSVADLAKQESSDSLNARVNALLTNKTLIDSALAHERLGSPAYVLLKNQERSIDSQLHKLGM